MSRCQSRSCGEWVVYGSASTRNQQRSHGFYVRHAQVPKQTLPTKGELAIPWGCLSRSVVKPQPHSQAIFKHISGLEQLSQPGSNSHLRKQSKAPWVCSFLMCAPGYVYILADSVSFFLGFWDLYSVCTHSQQVWQVLRHTCTGSDTLTYYMFQFWICDPEWRKVYGLCRSTCM